MHEQIEEQGRDIRDIPQPFLNTPIRSGIIHYGTGLGLVMETLTGTLEELEKLF